MAKGNRESPRLIGVAVLFTMIGFGAAAGTGKSVESPPPTEHRGLDVVRLGVVTEDSVQRQIGLTGHVLQLRRITIEPGGAIARHDHTNRPGLVLTTEGTWIEGRPGDERAYPAGEQNALVEDADTVHWFYNRGQAPATAVVCDIVPAS